MCAKTRTITLFVLLIIYSNNLFAQYNLYNFSARFEYAKRSENSLGKGKMFWNEVNVTDYYNLFNYSNNFKTEIGFDVFLLYNPRFNKEAKIYYNEAMAFSKIRQKYKSLFCSVAYYYKIGTIKAIDYPGGATLFMPYTKMIEQGLFIDAGIQLEFAEKQYIEITLGYERLRYTDVVDGLPKPVKDYTQHNYFMKAQTLSSNLRFSDISVLKTSDIEQQPRLMFLRSQLYMKIDTSTNNNRLFDSKCQLYFGKFIASKSILGLNIFLNYHEYDDTYATRSFIISPEFKYLFLKSFFTDVSYNFGFQKNEVNFLLQSISIGVGNYLKLTNKTILETRLFYSNETIFVGKYKKLFPYGNQINNRIGLIFKMLILF